MLAKSGGVDKIGTVERYAGTTVPGVAIVVSDADPIAAGSGATERTAPGICGADPVREVARQGTRAGQSPAPETQAKQETERIFVPVRGRSVLSANVGRQGAGLHSLEDCALNVQGGQAVLLLVSEPHGSRRPCTMAIVLGRRKAPAGRGIMLDAEMLARGASDWRVVERQFWLPILFVATVCPDAFPQASRLPMTAICSRGAQLGRGLTRRGLACSIATQSPAPPHVAAIPVPRRTSTQT